MLSVDITTIKSFPENDIKTATFPVSYTSPEALNKNDHIPKKVEDKSISRDTTINDAVDSNSTRQIFEKVKKIIVDKLGVEEKEITNEASFTNDLGADSLDTVELIMEFEKEFNVSIPDEAAEKITTVGKAVAYLEKRLQN